MQTHNHLPCHRIQIKQTTERDNSHLRSLPLLLAPSSFQVLCLVSTSFPPELDLEFKSTFQLIKTQTHRGEPRQLGVSLSLQSKGARPDSPVPSVRPCQDFFLRSPPLFLALERILGAGSILPFSAAPLPSAHLRRVNSLSICFTPVSLLLPVPCRCIPITPPFYPLPSSGFSVFLCSIGVSLFLSRAVSRSRVKPSATTGTAADEKGIWSLYLSLSLSSSRTRPYPSVSFVLCYSPGGRLRVLARS